MDVLKFECPDYLITVSTASVNYAWDRFVRRVRSAAQTYCAYSSSRKGTLKLMGKFYKENCLVDQAFIKDGNMDVNAYVNATAKKLGGDIKIVEYTHFIKGEGLEKRVDDFAAEVAAAV